MGPLGIFETSQRVRESIAWSRGKRFAAINGERVPPEKIIEGGYGEQYAGLVEEFSKLDKDDLVSYRNKFLQFLANPDALVQEFMPTVSQKTKLALRQAYLDQKSAEQDNL